MSTRTKFILTFVAGIITGVILVYAFSFCAVMYIKNEISSNNAVQMFDVPQQEVKADKFKIFQVLQDGRVV